MPIIQNDKLTPKQQAVFDYIKSYIDEHKFPPSHIEIQVSMGFKSPNAVTDHLQALVGKRWIRIVPKISRGIQILRSFT